MLAKANGGGEEGGGGGAPIVLDVRNGYEWDVGRFAGAHWYSSMVMSIQSVLMSIHQW